jgi:hypothetical protein
MLSDLVSGLVDVREETVVNPMTTVEQTARDPATVFYQARIHQVSGWRPE